MISGLVEEGGITLTEQLESVSLPSFSAEAVSDPSAETPSDSGKAYQAGERGKTPFTMPKYDLSPQIFPHREHVALVPVFRDNEVDSYFNVFERIAAALQWPPEIWTLLLQCKMHGKAQDAMGALPVEDSLNYETVKTAIL